MAGATRPTGRTLKLIEAIEEGAESAQIAAIERDAEAREGGKFGLVSFLRVRGASGDEGIRPQNILEILVQADQGATRNLALQANDHDIPDVAVGVKVVVKVDHLSAGKL